LGAASAAAMAAANAHGPRVSGPQAPLRGAAAARCDTASFPDACSSRVGVAIIDGNMPCEDRHSVRQLGEGLLAAAVMDGHGGWQVAEWLSRSLLPTLGRQLEGDGNSQDCSVFDALEAAFAECEAALLQQVESSQSPAGLARALRIGACALCAVVSPSHLAIANAGDCQALLLRGGEPIRVSVVHNADQPEEQRRLRDAHPDERDVFVCRGGAANALGGLQGLAQMAFGGQPDLRLTACYVKGRLQPTRSFGDFYLKDKRYASMGLIQPPLTPPYITAAPEIAVLPREREDQALILASDGLWDFLTGLDVARVAQEFLPGPNAKAPKDSGSDGATARALAEALIHEALHAAAKEHSLGIEDMRSVPPGPQRRRLHDDITVVVVLL